MTTPSTAPSRLVAKSFSVQDLLVDIRAGRLVVPNFQRPLKWRPQEGALFFDSIIRGYPVGTLFLWKRARGASKVDVRALLPGQLVDDDALLVIDGQQRLSGLARVLLRENPQDLRWDLAWALDEQRVRIASSRGRDTLVPLAELGDSPDLHECFAGQPASVSPIGGHSCPTPRWWRDDPGREVGRPPTHAEGACDRA